MVLSRVNAVELMYAAFPFFLTVNASYAGWLLDPVLEFASSPSWPYTYAPRDIGVFCVIITVGLQLIGVICRAELS